MEISKNAVNILACKTYKGIGTAWIANNLKGNESTEEIVSLLEKRNSKDSQVSLEGFKRIQDKILHELGKLKNIDGITALGDKNFPIPRGNIKKSEEITVLFYKGNINLLSRKNFNLAVIGLLKPTENIEYRERKIVSELVQQQGANIVSGLALGCDTIAHDECLKSGGKTVAILPNRLENVMPSANKKLALDIVENGGLLISEYYQESASQRELISRYIERDRLQALFSDGIVLSASYAKNNLGNDSGSRHAMQYAKNYGIARSVIFGNPQDESDFNSEQYALNRQILNEDSSVSILNTRNLESVKSFISKVKPKNKVQTVELSLFSQ